MFPPETVNSTEPSLKPVQLTSNTDTEITNSSGSVTVSVNS